MVFGRSAAYRGPRWLDLQRPRRIAVNKSQLIDALAEKLGDRKTAGAAVDGIVDVIVRAVQQGDRVAITGFGVFEKRDRAARTARNPRTGETVKVKKTTVPAFRAGTMFRDVVSGAKKLPKPAASAKTSKAKSTKTTKSG
jgi:DNA-binding protein HU-beta